FDSERQNRQYEEVYRRFLDYILHRLRRSLENPRPADAYPNAAAFRNDIRLMRDSLAANSGERMAKVLLDPLLRQIDTFGFHLHALDIRQHAKIHTRAIEELSSGTQIETKDEVALPALPSPETTQLLETLRAVAELKQAFSPQAIRSYV